MRPLSAPTLTPSLKPLDERVLAALEEGPTSARDVAARVHGWPGWTCDACGHVQRRGRRKWEGMTVLRCGRRVGDDVWCDGRWRPGALLTDAEAREVAEILHGLECVGHAHEHDHLWHLGAAHAA